MFQKRISVYPWDWLPKSRSSVCSGKCAWCPLLSLGQDEFIRFPENCLNSALLFFFYPSNINEGCQKIRAESSSMNMEVVCQNKIDA